MNATAKTNAQAAWDIWTSSGELMIWVDTTPLRGSGGADKRGIGTLSGHPFTFYVYGSSLPIIKLDENLPAGTIDLLAALKYFQAQGFLAANGTVLQINFGWEVCSTGGVPETFKLTEYSISGS
jgi:hypothetical protein